MENESTVLEETIKESKNKLFNLFCKLDISLLRLGLMALSIHDKECNSSNILHCEDLLLDIKKELSFFYSLDFQNKILTKGKKNDCL